MENESNSKIEKLEKCIDKHAKDIKKLKKKSRRTMTAMKFVGVIFDPEKFKTRRTCKMRSQTGKRHQETKEKTSKKDDSDEVCRCSI